MSYSGTLAIEPHKIQANTGLVYLEPLFPYIQACFLSGGVMRGSYFSIQSWMVTELNLKGVERDVYAIIYGFSQDEESDFHGSLSYLSKITGYSRNAICTALQSLVDKGYVIKTEKVVNNIKFCRYRTSDLDGVQVSCTGIAKNKAETVQVTWTHNKAVNKNINNKQNNKEIVKTSEIDNIKDLYNEHCFNLPKILKLTDKRTKAIKNIIKKYSVEEIIQAFDLANSSDFLIGNNDRGWKADMDFILREDKFVNILEGKYGGKKKINHVSSDMGRTVTRMTAEQKKQLREDIANGKAERI